MYTTRALTKAINESSDKPKVFVLLTGVGAYEPSDSIKYDETSASTGADFFSRLVGEWEKAAQVGPPVRLVSIVQISYSKTSDVWSTFEEKSLE